MKYVVVICVMYPKLIRLVGNGSFPFFLI